MMDTEKYFDILREDRRESEARLDAKLLQTVEERRDSEKRMAEERKEAEARLDARMNQMFESIEKIEERMDSRVNRIEDKFDETKRWIMGVCISTIVGIAAMVITIILTK